MFLHIIIIISVWSCGKYLAQVDFLSYYAKYIALLPGNEHLFLAYGSAAAFFLVMIAFMMRAVGVYALLHLVSRFFFEISQFIICLLSLVAIYFWVTAHVNVFKDLGLLVFVPLELILASVYCLNIYDFNYPVMSKLINNIMLLLVSGALIFLSDLLGLFAPPVEAQQPVILQKTS
ncbi:MAG: hypothetical protein KKE17_04535 [Proteobacteria bacterium]|nr:hypothetical protein [Pseudomonadota bacterium]MBU1709254.1 hypothetical protein [Pseudomonadota bacterium]